MSSTTQHTPHDTGCPQSTLSPPSGGAHATALPTAFPTVFPELFPPRDADSDTRRAWLVDSPWPEVVFASAL